MGREYDETRDRRPHERIEVGDDVSERGTQIQTRAIGVRQDSNRDEVDEGAESSN